MWWIISLVSAASQGARSMVMKDLGHRLDEYISVWGRFLFLMPFVLAASLLAGFPAIEPFYWPYTIAAGLSQAVSTTLLAKALKYGDFSISVAIWKIQVLFLLVFGVLFLKEKVTLLGIIGIVATLFGVYLLNAKRAQVSLIEPILLLGREKGLRYALFAAVAVTPTILLFKKTAQLADSYFAALTNHTFALLFMLPVVLRKSLKQFAALPRYISKLTAMGFFAATATIAGNLAYVLSVAAYVEAVKQVEIPLALLGGVLFFKEKERLREAWLGCLIILGGITLLILSQQQR